MSVRPGLTAVLSLLSVLGCTHEESSLTSAQQATPGEAARQGGSEATPAATPSGTESATTAPGAQATGPAVPETPTAPGQVDVAELVGQPQADELAAAPIRLPAGWRGSGVLTKRSDRLPRRAPSWARIAAEVTEHDGQRFLVTTGRVKKIKDAHLARSTAENRARAEIGRWIKNEKQTGGTVRQIWRDPRTGETFAQVEMPVPQDWVPGTPL
jgi:hypothetical protein